MVAGSSLFLSWVLPKMMAKPVKDQLLKEGRTGDGAPLATLAPKAFVPFLVRWVLLDGVTVIGMTTTILTGRTEFLYAFAAVALVGFALAFPSERNIRGFFN